MPIRRPPGSLLKMPVITKEYQARAALHIDSACECGWNNYKAGKDGSTGIADGYKNGIAL